MRITTAGASFAIAVLLALPSSGAIAQPQSEPVSAQTSPASDLSAQQRRPRRAPTRIRVYPLLPADGVYPRYYPGANAVRECSASYVQEFRPSGTVITPRLNCFWRPG